MLWVRGRPDAPAFPLLANRQTGADRAIARALKATNLILQSGVFGVMALDLADAPPQALRRVPMTTWLRFQRILEGQEAMGVIVGSAPMSRSAGGVSVSLQTRDSRLRPTPLFELRRASAGQAGLGESESVFRGFESDVRTARARLVPGVDASPVRLQVSA
jgi:hypothetical protein